jgi:hypothetical protein
MGPVPVNFDSIFEYLANKNDFEISYTAFPDGGMWEQFKPIRKRAFNPDVFSQQELAVLDHVATRFKTTTTSEIIEMSHKEEGWIKNVEDKGIIDYGFGFELR